MALFPVVLLPKFYFFSNVKNSLKLTNLKGSVLVDSPLNKKEIYNEK